jgi:hypothetical protein
MYPGVKSVIWRSDAIPQVGLDARHALSAMYPEVEVCSLTEWRNTPGRHGTRISETFTTLGAHSVNTNNSDHPLACLHCSRDKNPLQGVPNRLSLLFSLFAYCADLQGSIVNRQALRPATSNVIVTVAICLAFSVEFCGGCNLTLVFPHWPRSNRGTWQWLARFMLFY